MWKRVLLLCLGVFVTLAPVLSEADHGSATYTLRDLAGLSLFQGCPTFGLGDGGPPLLRFVLQPLIPCVAFVGVGQRQRPWGCHVEGDPTQAFAVDRGQLVELRGAELAYTWRCCQKRYDGSNRCHED